jgi:hypothetical protein
MRFRIAVVVLVSSGCMHRTISDQALTDRAEGLADEQTSRATPAYDCDGLPFAGGSGTPTDPYRVCSAAQLASIGNDPTLLAATYRVTADLDLASEPSLQIGSSTHAFTGHFDGAGHTLRNLVQVTADDGGLFARIDTGTVEDLHLVDVSIEGGTTGTLVGTLIDGTVARCSAIGRADAGHGVVGGVAGGLIGATATRTTGTETMARVYGSFALVDVTASGYAGGLIGQTSYTDVRWSFAGGSVDGTHRAGGLVGYCWSTPGVSASFASGDVTGTEMVGGLIGFANGFCDSRDVYATGTVTGIDQVGGVIGFRNTLPGTYYMYSTGVVNGASSNTGALVGYAGDIGESFLGCFVANDVNPGLPALGNGTNSEVRSVTSDTMRQASTFTARGWDFDNIWTIDPELNDGFPVFQWQLE